MCAVMIASLLMVIVVIIDHIRKAQSLDFDRLVWPSPLFELYMNQNNKSSALQIISVFNFTYECYGFCHDIDVQTLLGNAEKRFIQSLMMQIPHDANQFPINPDHRNMWSLRGVRVQIESPNRELQHGVDESYTIDVRPAVENNQFILLKALTIFGAMHGMQTLLQLIEFGWMDTSKSHFNNPSVVFTISNAPLLIIDRPMYSYRGLMIDTSRHYLPMSLILRNLDAMEMNKLNALHWHMTDSQSWPYRSTMYPELSSKGAFCPECIYTPEDVQHVVQEAFHRGVRVVLEVDLPGHSQAVGASHPELLSECGDRVPSEPIDVTHSEAFVFVRNLYEELDGLIFDKWIHVGGDEVSLNCWKHSSRVQKWMHEHNMTSEVELLNDFETKLLNFVTKMLNKKPIVWQDLFDSDVRLPKETIVDIWQSWNDVRKEATLHHDVIVSHCWYLDHLDRDWKSFYACDPREFNGTKHQLARVIGGHSSMWGERVDEENFMSRVWPRTAAMAEKLWTGTVKYASATAEDRLDQFRCAMVQRGFEASPIRPGICESERTWSDKRQ